MTPQSASELSTPRIPSALRSEEANRPGRAHPNLSAQSAGTPARGFPVRPLRPSKLDPICPPPPNPPHPPQFAPSATPRHPPQSRPPHPPQSALSAPSAPSTVVRLVYSSLPCPGFCSPLRPLRPPIPLSAPSAPVRPSPPRPGFRTPLRPLVCPVRRVLYSA